MWAHRRKVKLQFSCPGKPSDNQFIDSFNNEQRKIEEWRIDYDERRPHSSLENSTLVTILWFGSKFNKRKNEQISDLKTGYGDVYT